MLSTLYEKQIFDPTYQFDDNLNDNASTNYENDNGLAHDNDDVDIDPSRVGGAPLQVDSNFDYCQVCLDMVLLQNRVLFHFFFLSHSFYIYIYIVVYLI